MGKKVWVVAEMGLTLVVAASMVEAFGLGIPLDGFITTVETSMVGLGIPLGLAGGVSFIVSKFDQTYGPMLSGYIPYFVAGGVLGGLSTILGTIGLTSGAVLLGV